MRVEARRALLVDSAIGLIVAVTSWIASFYVWDRSEFNRPDWGTRTTRPSNQHRGFVPMGAACRHRSRAGHRDEAAVAACCFRRDGSGRRHVPGHGCDVRADLSWPGPRRVRDGKRNASARRRKPCGGLRPGGTGTSQLGAVADLARTDDHGRALARALPRPAQPSLVRGSGHVVAIAVVPATIALLLRARREGEREVREQERRRYAYEERLRIARDVHDVVGHSLAVITMQAGVALHVLDKERTAQPRPDRVAESLEAIKKTSREALAELRTTLEVFRSDAEEPLSPVPGLGRLDDLVERTALGRPRRDRGTGELDDDLGTAAGGGRSSRFPDHSGVADQRRAACGYGPCHRTGGR